MRKFLVVAGILTASATLAGCNPPVKQISVPCNCHGSVATANPGAENQRFIPQGTTEEHFASSPRQHRHAGPYSPAYASYGERRRYRHGYEGSDESYARDWSASRVAMSSYDYRSSSHIYETSGYASSYGYADSDAYESSPRDDGFVGAREQNESGWEDGYGRDHQGSRLSQGEYYARMDPWHGYDADCYGRGHRRYRRYR
jgi:hypothetical protein